MLKIIIDHKLCIGCGLCVDSCPVPVFEFDEDQELPVVVDLQGCLICRTCEGLCCAGALKVEYPDYELTFNLIGEF